MIFVGPTLRRIQEEPAALQAHSREQSIRARAVELYPGGAAWCYPHRGRLFERNAILRAQIAPRVLRDTNDMARRLAGSPIKVIALSEFLRAEELREVEMLQIAHCQDLRKGRQVRMDVAVNRVHKIEIELPIPAECLHRRRHDLLALERLRESIRNRCTEALDLPLSSVRENSAAAKRFRKTPFCESAARRECAIG